MKISPYFQSIMHQTDSAYNILTSGNDVSAAYACSVGTANKLWLFTKSTFTLLRFDYETCYKNRKKNVEPPAKTQSQIPEIKQVASISYEKEATVRSYEPAWAPARGGGHLPLPPLELKKNAVIFCRPTKKTLRRSLHTTLNLV